MRKVSVSGFRMLAGAIRVPPVEVDHLQETEQQRPDGQVRVPRDGSHLCSPQLIYALLPQEGHGGGKNVHFSALRPCS